MKFGRLRAATIGGALSLLLLISFNERPANAISIPIPYGQSVLTLAVTPSVPLNVFSAAILLDVNDTACSGLFSGCYAQWSLSIDQYDQNNNSLGSWGGFLNRQCFGETYPTFCYNNPGQFAFGPMLLDTTTLVVHSSVSVGGGWIFESAAVIIQSSAQIAETPLPAALPLFATGLGALGLMGWRRKRKAADINRAVAWGRVP